MFGAQGPAAPQQPFASPPQQPFTSAPQQPFAGEPQPTPPYSSPPYSSPPGPHWQQQAPFAAGGYPPAAGGGGYPPPAGPGYPPPAGPGYPPPAGPGYPPPAGSGYPPGMPPPATGANSTKTVLIIVVIAAVLALLCCVGGIVTMVVGANRAANETIESIPELGGPPTPAPSSSGGPPMNMPAGNSAQIDDERGVLKVTVTKFSTVTEPCRTSGLKPDKGMYLTADVTVSIVEGTGSINQLHFWWIAADGTKTSTIAGILSGCGTTLRPGTNLTAGTTHTGTIVFNVPDTNGILEYQHRFKTAASWKP
ncbi:hypothetical protein [Micromonospora profundi]|uniref:hypothetical protein n=1 Tax=Micromonospora profundi TaxID=1420889 RepID=UPI0036617F07